MSDRDLDPGEYDEIPDESEQLDQDPFQPDYGLEDRGVDDALDEGLTTPENWSVLERRGDHETLDERLAEEEPDAGEQAPGEPEEADEFDDFVDDGEVGRERAGRLVDPNEGIGADDESELVGDDVGIDGAAASAEEAAVHVVDTPDEVDERADERADEQD